MLFGRTEYWGSRGLQLTAPEFEVLQEDGENEPLHTGRIVPIYERTGSVTPNMHRTLAFRALETLTAPLPDIVPAAMAGAPRLARPAHGLPAGALPDAGTSLEALNACATAAQRRIIFEDFFVYQTGLALRRRQNALVQKPHLIAIDDPLRDRVRQVLPFKLTQGQRDAVRDIVADMQRRWPMQRLLQGDVGSGKTMVAFLAAMVAMENGYQVAVMAPTEILAEQHLQTFSRWLEGTRFRVALLTGRKADAARRRLGAAIEAGDVVARHRHPRAGAGGGALSRPGARHRRRAASLRRRAARRCLPTRACIPTCCS